MACRKQKPDVSYYLPNKKRPIAYSSKSTCDLIGLLSEIFYSIKDVQMAIFFDQKAKDILQIYIDKGYAYTIASGFFSYDDFTFSLNWYTKPYAILLSNFPFANTIDQLKQYIEFHIAANGKRKWVLKEPFKLWLTHVWNINTWYLQLT